MRSLPSIITPVRELGDRQVHLPQDFALIFHISVWSLHLDRAAWPWVLFQSSSQKPSNFPLLSGLQSFHFDSLFSNGNKYSIVRARFRRAIALLWLFGLSGTQDWYVFSPSDFQPLEKPGACQSAGRCMASWSLDWGCRGFSMELCNLREFSLKLQ